jgi:hypothetical protein
MGLKGKITGKYVTFLIVVTTISFLLFTGTSTAYYIVINSPSTVIQGNALVVTGTTNFPAGIAFDIVLSNIDNYPNMIRKQTVNVFTDGSMGAIFDTADLPSGLYRLNVPDISNFQLESGSITTRNVQIINYSSGSVVSPLNLLTFTPTPSPTLINPGSITVASSPSDAIVIVDGTHFKKTPCTFYNIESGSHHIEVQKAGYTSWNTTVWVRGGKTTHTSVTLSPLVVEPTQDVLPESGSIRVTSRPSEATVYLDNTSVGLTPLTIASVDTGSHTVVVSMEGYNDWEAGIQVKPGSESAVDAVLAVKPTPSSTAMSLGSSLTILAMILSCLILLSVKK